MQLRDRPMMGPLHFGPLTGCTRPGMAAFLLKVPLYLLCPEAPRGGVRRLLLQAWRGSWGGNGSWWYMAGCVWEALGWLPSLLGWQCRGEPYMPIDLFQVQRVAMRDIV
jgi:hypothetical protein